MLGKVSVIGFSVAFAACVFGATAGFSEDASPPAGAGYDRSSERQHADDQNEKWNADYCSTQRRCPTWSR